MSKIQAKKKIAFFDIDGTIRNMSLTQALYRVLVSGVYKYRGNNPDWIRNRPSEIEVLHQYYKDQRTTKGTIYENKTRDELFSVCGEAMTEFIMVALEGYSKEEVLQIGYQIANDYKYEDYLYSSVLLEELKSEGYDIVAISGSPEFLVKPFAELYGFTKAYGQEYTKNPETSIYEPAERRTYCDKHILMEHYLQEAGIARADAFIVAVGDTAGDATMLQEANVAFAMNPSGGLAMAMRDRLKNYCEINPGKGYMRVVEPVQISGYWIIRQEKSLLNVDDARNRKLIRDDIRARISGEYKAALQFNKP